MGGGRRMMQGGEKAKNFGGSFKKLIRYIGNYKFAILAVMIFAGNIYSIFSSWTKGYGKGNYCSWPKA